MLASPDAVRGRLKNNRLGDIGAGRETDFDEFSACSDAEAVFGRVPGVAVIVAPRDILLVIHMANDRHRDQNDSYADDESSSYQLFHFDFHPHPWGSPKPLHGLAWGVLRHASLKLRHIVDGAGV